MTYTTYKTNSSSHGGYRKLLSFQTTTIIYDLTVQFCQTYMTYTTNRSYRMVDQMIQAARSGRQNIAEGSQASATSKKTEIKLVGVARASLEELLVDYEDYLRQHNLPLWAKDNPQVKAVRALGYKSYRSYTTYKTYMQKPEDFANCLVTLIHQANFLLDKQLQALEKSFIQEGGYTENLFKKRLESRQTNI